MTLLAHKGRQPVVNCEAGLLFTVAFKVFLF